MMLLAIFGTALVVATFVALPRRWAWRVVAGIGVLVVGIWGALFLTEPPTQTFTFEGKRFGVPDAYAPVSFAENTLSISVTPPDMVPDPMADVPNVWLRLGRGETVARPLPEDAVFEPAEYGLERAISPSDPVRNLFVLRANDRVQTFVECFDNFCLHRFTETGDDLITFEHDLAQLADWKLMQERLVTLFDSFAR